ncbi:hypothetical protein MCAV_05460 [[Mycoplasma] cavipharyngis]
MLNNEIQHIWITKKTIILIMKKLFQLLSQIHLFNHVTKIKQ